MNAFLQFSENNLWGELWPEITLALGAVFVLLVDLFSRNKNGSKYLRNLCCSFQAVLLICHLLDYLLFNHTFDRSSFSGMLRHGFQGDVIRTFFYFLFCFYYRKSLFNDQ